MNSILSAIEHLNNEPLMFLFAGGKNNDHDLLNITLVGRNYISFTHASRDICMSDALSCFLLDFHWFVCSIY